MDDGTDGWMESFISSWRPLLGTSVSPVHNAQVCYFKQLLIPPSHRPADPSHPSLRFFNPSIPSAGPFHSSLRFFNPSTPPAGPSHSPFRFFNPSIPKVPNVFLKGVSEKKLTSLPPFRPIKSRTNLANRISDARTNRETLNPDTPKRITITLSDTRHTEWYPLRTHPRRYPSHWVISWH
jgi:hypothetical protein